MLISLFIENIALIDKLGIELFPGFNVLSGETGAGKSIIIDAVNFVLGSRSTRELIKYGAPKGKVEAVFSIKDNAAVCAYLAKLQIPYEDDEIILSREMTAAGRNTCRVNGEILPVSALKSVADMLIDIHGQHENQAFLDPDNHGTYLDAYCRGESYPLLDKISESVKAYNALKTKRNSGFSSQQEREREIDILRYQIDEIDAAMLGENEDVQLSEERTKLINAEKIRTAISTAYGALAGEESCALSLVDCARRSFGDISLYSKEYEDFFTKLEELYYATEDIGFAIRDAQGGIEFDLDRLNEIESRLKLIADLKRKYGKTIEDIFAFRNNAEEKLTDLINAETFAAQLDEKMAAIKWEYDGLCEKLSEVRQKAAGTLKIAVENELSQLGMAKARFDVQFDKIGSGELNPIGGERAVFMLSANPGEPLKPVDKVASGGELSRIMLCFKSIFADNDSIPTLIFDEIDTGISGHIAAVVGEKMLGISKTHQVICVTHLAQIAALADNHLLVSKYDDGDSTFVKVRQIEGDEKTQRIALMMDGSTDSPSAIEHAKVLIDRANAIKKDTNR